MFQICAALPGFHAFTGCDYTTAFIRKGKVRPYDWLVKDKESRDAFGKLGTSTNVPKAVQTYLNKFTCLLYGQKGKCTDVNVARLKILEGKLPRTSKQKLQKLKSFDPATLPPCLNELGQKIKRVNYVCHIWQSAHKAVISSWDPCRHGWKNDNGQLKPIWFLGERVPDELFYEDEQSDEEDNYQDWGEQEDWGFKDSDDESADEDM